MKKYRRRNYFIRKGFQAKFILRFMGISVIGSILAVGLFNVLAYRRIDSILYSMRIRPDIAGSFFLSEALYANIGALVFVIAACFFTAQAIFSKITGPLSHIRIELQKIKDGYLGLRIALRHGDEFGDFADGINAMTSSLRARFSSMKSIVHELSRSVRDISEMQEERDIIAARDNIMDQISAFERELRTFRK